MKLYCFFVAVVSSLALGLFIGVFLTLSSVGGREESRKVGSKNLSDFLLADSCGHENKSDDLRVTDGVRKSSSHLRRLCRWTRGSTDVLFSIKLTRTMTRCAAGSIGHLGEPRADVTKHAVAMFLRLVS